MVGGERPGFAGNGRCECSAARAGGDCRIAGMGKAVGKSEGLGLATRTRDTRRDTHGHTLNVEQHEIS